MSGTGSPYSRPAKQTLAPTPEATEPPAWSRWLGLTALIAATVASFMLVLHHFGAMELPGCGIGNPCDVVAKSRFGRLPFVDWPMSFLGLAYFGSLTASWMSSKGRMQASMRSIVRVGAAASLLYTGILLGMGQHCVYCLAVHAANLVFLAILERTPPCGRGHRGWHPLVATGTFLIVTGVLAAGNSVVSQRATEKAEQETAASIKKMTTPAPSSPSTLPPATPPVAPTTKPPTTPPSSQTPTTPPVTPTPPAPETKVQAEPPVNTSVNPLLGRYPSGPEKAAIRVVIWMGYQCEDCNRVEKELADLMKDATLSMSVVIRHFPLNQDCNPHAPGKHHGNACWAARAAESAGILGGKDGFWKMHNWLFNQKGDFSNAQLDAAVTSMGWDAKAFALMMNDPRTMAAVRADADAAMELGIFQTPFIFINGVELKGWNAPQSLTRAVRAVAASNPPAKTFAEDQAPNAAAKVVNDWRSMPRVSMPAAVKTLQRGPNEADVEVVVWGDYAEPGTAEVDGLLRMYLAPQHPSIKYTFMQFPANKECNPLIQVAKFPLSCRAAKAVKAAEMLAGPDGFWKMHERLFLNTDTMNDAMLEAVAMELGLKPSDLLEAMELPDVRTMIQQEAKMAMDLKITSIPLVFVDGKQLARFKIGFENVIPQILEAAIEDKKPK